MPRYPAEEIKSHFEKLPQSLKEAMFSVDTAERMVEFGRKYGLTIEQIGYAAEEGGYIILGLTRPHEFVQALKNHLKITDDDARKIASDINHQIFFPLREELKKAHEFSITEDEIQRKEEGISTKSSAAPPTQRITPPIVSVPPRPAPLQTQQKPPALPATPKPLPTPSTPPLTAKQPAPSPPPPAEPPEATPVPLSKIPPLDLRKPVVGSHPSGVLFPPPQREKKSPDQTTQPALKLPPAEPSIPSALTPISTLPVAPRSPATPDENKDPYREPVE